jgi:hypothetical protein
MFEYAIWSFIVLNSMTTGVVTPTEGGHRVLPPRLGVARRLATGRRALRLT